MFVFRFNLLFVLQTQAYLLICLCT